MTITSSPPMRTSPMLIIVSSGLERAARQLVRFGDAHHFVHTFEHFQQPRIAPAAPPPTAPITVRNAPGGPVNVESHVDQLRHHALDLLFRGALFHHNDHDLCPLSAARSSAVGREPYRPWPARLPLSRWRSSPPCLVDDALEQPRDGVVIERTAR